MSHLCWVSGSYRAYGMYDAQYHSKASHWMTTKMTVAGMDTNWCKINHSSNRSPYIKRKYKRQNHCKEKDDCSANTNRIELRRHKSTKTSQSPSHHQPSPTKIPSFDIDALDPPRNRYWWLKSIERTINEPHQRHQVSQCIKNSESNQF